MKQLGSFKLIKSLRTARSVQTKSVNGISGTGKRPLRRKTGLVAATAAGLSLMAAQSTALGNEWRSSPGYGYKKHHNYARVIDVHPIYHKVRLKKPQRHCTTHYQEYYSSGIQGNYSGNYDNEYNDYNYGNKRNKRKRRDNVGAPLAGAIVGGVIGNQIGRSSRGDGGRIGATIAGALIGSVVAGAADNSSWRKRRSGSHVRERFQHHNQYGYTQQYSDGKPHRQHLTSRPVEHCSTRYVSYTEDRLQGYKVSYRFHGRIYSIRTQKHPGKRIRVNRRGRPLY